MSKRIDIDWGKLKYDYIKTDYRYISYYKNGKWDDGHLIEDDKISINVGSTALHYGQECFEGLKAYRTKEGHIQLFRPDENAKRMISSCRRLLMPEFPVERFVEACKKVVKANEEFVPPHGTGSTLYIRPFMIGVGGNLGLKAAKEYIFCIFVIPVGPYFADGLSPVNFMVTDYDRAAPNGTGSVKAGGNYAGGLLPNQEAHDKGYSGCLYLDAKTKTKIEEVGAANFFGITKDNEFVTPKSDSILPSITKISLMHIAKEYLDLKVIERDCYIDEIDEFVEAGACGTAAVITPVGGVFYNNKLHVFYSEKEAGPITKKLYDILYGIQFGDVKAPKNWIYKID